MADGEQLNQITTNPYPKGSRESAAWEHGYFACKQQMIDKLRKSVATEVPKADYEKAISRSIEVTENDRTQTNSGE